MCIECNRVDTIDILNKRYTCISPVHPHSSVALNVGYSVHFISGELGCGNART